MSDILITYGWQAVKRQYMYDCFSASLSRLLVFPLKDNYNMLTVELLFWKNLTYRASKQSSSKSCCLPSGQNPKLGDHPSDSCPHQLTEYICSCPSFEEAISFICSLKMGHTMVTTNPLNAKNAFEKCTFQFTNKTFWETKLTPHTVTHMIKKKGIIGTYN